MTQAMYGLLTFYDNGMADKWKLRVNLLPEKKWERTLCLKTKLVYILLLYTGNENQQKKHLGNGFQCR